MQASSQKLSPIKFGLQVAGGGVVVVVVVGLRHSHVVQYSSQFVIAWGEQQSSSS